MRMLRARVISRTTATTAKTISPAISFLLFVDEGGSALDLQYFNPLPGLERVILVEGARTPHLARQLDRPALAVDALQDRCRLAHQSRGARPQAGRRLDVAPGHRAQDGDRRRRY